MQLNERARELVRVLEGEALVQPTRRGGVENVAERLGVEFHHDRRLLVH